MLRPIGTQVARVCISSDINNFRAATNPLYRSPYIQLVVRLCVLIRVVEVTEWCVLHMSFLSITTGMLLLFSQPKYESPC